MIKLGGRLYCSQELRQADLLVPVAKLIVGLMWYAMLIQVPPAPLLLTFVCTDVGNADIDFIVVFFIFILGIGRLTYFHK